MRADASPATLLASAPSALVRADARTPALLAFVPLALMRALRALLLWRPAALLVVFDPIAFIAARLFLLGDTVAWLRHPPPLTALLPLGSPATLLRLDWRWSLIPRCTAHFPQSQDSPADEFSAKGFGVAQSPPFCVALALPLFCLPLLPQRNGLAIIRSPCNWQLAWLGRKQGSVRAGRRPGLATYLIRSPALLAVCGRKQASVRGGTKDRPGDISNSLCSWPH